MLAWIFPLSLVSIRENVPKKEKKPLNRVNRTHLLSRFSRSPGAHTLLLRHFQYNKFYLGLSRVYGRGLYRCLLPRTHILLAAVVFVTQLNTVQTTLLSVLNGRKNVLELPIFCHVRNDIGFVVNL